jgi:hypothetical protein
MIMVRFKDTFRERLPEWISSITLLMWGLMVLFEPATLWHRDFFEAMATIASQTIWGLVATTVAIVKLLSLTVNGAWRPTAHFRAIGAFSSIMIWATLLISFVALTWNPPTIALIAGVLLTDLFALWFAAGDAKLADVRARELK